MTKNNVETVDRSEWLLALPRLAVLAVKLGFDRSVPWETKTALGGGLLYILSPIDGIPDFIPVLGLLDDLLLVPAGILLFRRLEWPEIWQATGPAIGLFAALGLAAGWHPAYAQSARRIAATRAFDR